MERSIDPASDDSRRAEGKDEEPPLARALLAETLGTFALVFAAVGGGAVAAVSEGAVSHAARAVAPGLMVMALIYAIGDASGAHFNPAVSLAFALRRDFPWRRLLPYWGVQVVGATLAALFWRALLSAKAVAAGATHPHVIGVASTLLLEAVLAGLLLLIILGTATRYSLVGPNAAVAVGGTIALCGLIAEPLCGASMNPARSLGPALVTGDFYGLSAYLVGPLVGATVAAGLMAILHPASDRKEGEAACGKPQEKEVRDGEQE